MKQLLTNSRMSCAKSCLRKHYYRYELGLVKDRETQPLRMGSAVHLGLDLRSQSKPFEEAAESVAAGYQHVPEWAEIDEWATERETVLRLLHGYYWRYQADDVEVVATEQEFRLPITNPATGGEAKLFDLGGKIDKIVKLPDGRVAVMEHKTSSDSLGSDSDYWPRLRLDSQISLYVLAARDLGYDVQTVLYDVIRKPSIRPKSLTKSEQKQVAVTRLWCGETVGIQDGDWPVPERETPAMYGARLTNDIVSRPDFYFQRREIPRLQADLDEFRHELWQQQQSLRECQRMGRWFRNSQSCLMPYRCTYFDLCSNGVEVNGTVPDGFVRVVNVHPELQEVTSRD